jgi:ParB-like chromosome segregation protein Spo0J
VLRPDELEAEVVSVGSLVPFPGNPRRGDVPAIKDSLQAHGQYRPLVANRRTRRVLGGNHALRAAIELGWDSIAVT